MLALLLSVLINTLNAQELVVNKTLFVGGNNCYSACKDIVRLSDGFLFTGKSICNGTGDIPSTPYALDNVIVGKIDNNLQLKWIKVLGGAKEDIGITICKPIDGGIAVLASTNSDDGDVTGFHGGSNGGTDIWLIKMDEMGNKLWSMCYGSNYSESALSMACTPDSGFIILGNSTGYGDDVPFHHGSSQFITDWFVIKVDKLGNKQWTKTLGGTGNDGNVAGSIIVANNGYYVVSSSASKDNDCVDDSWHPTTNTGSDYYLLRLDALGNVLWSKSYGGSKTENLTKALMNEVDSSIVMIGHSYSNDFMVDTNFSQGVNYEDIWVLKVNKDGVPIWSKSLGGSKSELDQTISKFGNGYAVYSNTYSKELSKVPETWLFILDENGKIVTDKLIGGTGVDLIGCLQEYENGLLLCGASSSDEFVDGTRFGNVNTSIGEDAFFSKVYYFPTTITSPTIDRSRLKLYPNPATNIVKIDIVAKGKGVLVIYNGVGQKVFEKGYKGAGTNLIDISDWPNGAYEVILRNSTEQKVSAVLIKQ